MNLKKSVFMELRKRVLKFKDDNLFVVYYIVNIELCKLIVTRFNINVNRLKSKFKRLSTFDNELYLSVSFI